MTEGVVQARRTSSARRGTDEASSLIERKRVRPPDGQSVWK